MWRVYFNALMTIAERIQKQLDAGNNFIALKYPSTYVALKYSIYITPKGALKNVIIQSHGIIQKKYGCISS